MLWQWELTRHRLRSSNQSHSFDQPDQLLPKPCSDLRSYEQHSTNELLANEWPVNCQTPQWFQLMNKSAEHESDPLESCFKHPDFPIHLLVKDTRRHLRGKTSQSWKKTKSAIPGLWGPSCSPWFFLYLCCWGKKKKRKTRRNINWLRLSSLLLPFFPKQHTFLKYFLHAAAFSVLFLETSVKPLEWTDFPLVSAV